MTESKTPRVVSDGFLSRAELSRTRVLVIGLGISGMAVARVLAGTGARVYASEMTDVSAAPEVAELRELGIEIESGGHKKANRWISSVDIVIPSPGISPRSGIVAHAIAEGVPVLSEIELAYRFVRSPIVAVTGTNGKTTTSRLIGEMLTADGRSAVTCGNIGVPFISAVMQDPDADVFVVEVSSFQLTFCYAFHPRVAVITNLAPDHIDWHGTMEGYKVAKGRIASKQTRGDYFVYPAAQPELAALAPPQGPTRIPFSMSVLPSGDGVWLDRGHVAARVSSEMVQRVAPAAHMASKGRPLLEDALAATAASLVMGAESEAVGRVLETFEPDPHRLQLVREVDGRRFVDDSKATNAHATLAALRGFTHVVLIAGGRNRSQDLESLRAESGRIRALVAVGEAGPEVIKVFDGTGVRTRTAASMADAVDAAYHLSEPGDVVLLSPACASLDQFENYAERGRVFAEAVNALEAKT